MRPVSDAWKRTVTASHTMIARARVCETFQTGTNPAGTAIPILGGDVILDGTAQIRSTLDLTTDGNRMWPQFADDLLPPYGNEIYVERGIQYHDGLIEYVGLGYFRIQTPDQDDAPNSPIRLSGRDRMAGIIDGRLVAPRQFLPGATLGHIMSTLVQEVYPTAIIEWDDSTDTAVITRSMICEEDRFEFLDSLVKGRGKIWYWDQRGILVIKSVPSPTEPVADIMSGPGGVLIELSRSLTRERVYNAVVASGEAADTADPVHHVAIDANPKSPTYFHGRFGPVPKFFRSQFLTAGTVAAAAEAMLRRELGLPYNINFRAVANPALEPWDPVAIRPGIGQGRETHVLERLTIPLMPRAAMTAQTREQTVVLVGSI